MSIENVKLKCKMAGKSVKTLDGLPVACEFCDGIIILQIVNDKIINKTLKVSMFGRLPQIPYAMFNCPVTLKDPRNSSIIEKTI